MNGPISGIDTAKTVSDGRRSAIDAQFAVAGFVTFQNAAQSKPHRQGRAGREHSQHETAIELHRSISLTFFIRSRVENGLVT